MKAIGKTDFKWEMYLHILNISLEIFRFKYFFHILSYEKMTKQLNIINCGR